MATIPAQSLRAPSAEREAAWVGLLQVHADLTRAIDAELSAKVGLSLSAFEVLLRVAGADDGLMRISDVAEAALLSPSRASRLVTELEQRGLIERRPCASDSRVVHARCTEQGRELLGRAFELYWERVERQLFANLTDEQVRALAELWPRVLGREPGPCPT